jgi:ureidoglycolate lyase
VSRPAPRVQPVTIEPLTDEAFRPFGQVLGASERAPDYRGGGGSYGWRVDFQADGRPRVSVSVAPFQGLRFSRLEQHFHVTQTFVPLDGAPAVVAVAPPTDPADREAIPAPESIRAFRIDGTKGYLLGKGTWHSIDRFPLSPPSTLFVVLNERETAEDPARSQIVDYAARFGVTFELIP